MRIYGGRKGVGEGNMEEEKEAKEEEGEVEEQE